MNSYVVAFAALIIAVHGGSLRVTRQSTGWGASPPSATIDIEVEADAAATGFGASDASQELAAQAVGIAENPALIHITASTVAEVDREIDLNQLVIADLLTTLTSSSVNQAVAGNIALAADILFGTVSGGTSAVLVSNAADNASGNGIVPTNASSSNVQSR